MLNPNRPALSVFQTQTTTIERLRADCEVAVNTVERGFSLVVTLFGGLHSYIFSLYLLLLLVSWRLNVCVTQFVVVYNRGLFHENFRVGQRPFSMP